MIGLIFTSLFRLFCLIIPNQCLTHGLTWSRNLMNICQMNEWIFLLDSDAQIYDPSWGQEFSGAPMNILLTLGNTGDNWYINWFPFYNNQHTSYMANYSYTAIIIQLSKLQVLSHRLLSRSLRSLRAGAVCSLSVWTCLLVLSNSARCVMNICWVSKWLPYPEYRLVQG